MLLRIILPFVFVVASIFGAMTLMATAPVLEPNMPEPVATTVRVISAEPMSMQLTVTSQGTVAPNTESELIPEVTGRVVWMSPALVNGGYFNAGDELIRVDDKDYRTGAQRAKASLARARAEHEHASFENDRFQSLVKRQLASRSQAENAVRTLRVAQAVLAEAQANAEQAQRDIDRTSIRAPFTGLVRKESVDIGQFLSRGQSIATLYASKEAEVRLPIADRQLAFLNLPVTHRGELPKELQPKVTLRAEYAGQDMVWEGHIVRLEAAIDTSSRMVHVVARVDNASQAAPLSVGLFVNAEIEGLLVDDVIQLPRQALRNGNRVLVVDEDNRLRYREIKTLRMYEDNVLVKSGLAAGERVCISPLQTPIDGMQVRTDEMVSDSLDSPDIAG